jgi:predicted adenylyl cyclase CyaB
MTELEAKFRVESHDDVRDRLRRAGGEFIGQYLEWNVILDDGVGSLRASGSGLRVRDLTTLKGEAKPATLTYKGPREVSVYKRREEIETSVSDAVAATALLERIGFVTSVSYEKRRETWRLENCTIELDAAPLIGLFVEVEGVTEADIDGVRGALGLEGHVVVTSSYVRLIVEACRAAGRASVDVRFD